MQVIEDKYSGNIFGRIGAGLGKGLSEQLPKEIERGRLSAGLRKFEKESKGLTPIQQFTRLAAIPGITPEHLYTLSPLLKQQAAREEGIRNFTNRENEPINQLTPSAAPKGTVPSYPKETEEAGAKRPLKTIEATRRQLEPIIEKSPQEMLGEAAQLSQQNPLTYPTPQDALPFVQANEQTRIKNLQEERNVADVADKTQERLRQRLLSTMGGEKTSKDVEGTIQTKLLRNIEDELANPQNKLSEQQIVDKWASVGKRIAQAKTNLDAKAKSGWLASLGATGGLIGAAATTLASDYLPKKIRDTIDATRKVYHEANADEEFADIISHKFDLSSAGSAYLTYPRENKGFNNFLSNIKVSKNANPEKLAIAAADYFMDHITDDDSILSYAMELKKKGIDPNAFFDRMKQNSEVGAFDPNPRQQNEFQKGYPNLPSLGDMYIFSLMKQNKLATP